MGWVEEGHMELLDFSKKASEEATTPRKWTFGIKREECSTEKLRLRRVWSKGAVMGAEGLCPPAVLAPPRALICDCDGVRGRLSCARGHCTTLGGAHDLVVIAGMYCCFDRYPA